MNKEKTPWEKKLEKSRTNIGFLTKAGGFKDPTPSEIASALSIETKSWQATRGKRPYRVSEPYSTPKGHGVNLLATRESGEPVRGPERQKAVDAYIHIPMDPDGILTSQKIDVEQYEKPKSIFRRIKDWFGKKQKIGHKKAPSEEIYAFFKALGVSLKKDGDQK